MAKGNKSQRRMARKRAQHQRARERNGPGRATGPFGDHGADHGSDPGSDPGFQSGPPPVEVAMQALMAVATVSLDGDTAAVDAGVGRLTASLQPWPRVLDTAVAGVLRTQVERLWAAGWLPVDLHEVARRQASDLVAALIVDALTDATGQYPVATTHPRWLAQLSELDAHPWWDGGRRYPGQWAERHGADMGTLLEVTVEALALSMRLPSLQLILPPPGQAHGQQPGAGQKGAVDEKVLARVRALLAKAESTSFPEEAEALSAKAQELMSRYSIERAMTESAGRRAPVASARRVWLDAPYLSAKTLLVAEVGSANHCRTVSSEKLGFVTVLGAESDLDVVEVLSTSLLVQATRAMLSTGSQVSQYGTSRTRSFRHSFLLSYATRIGERLRDTANTTEAAAGAELVPVFAERVQAVDTLFDSLFTNTVRRSFSARNAAGWGAGRSAADNAVLNAERSAVGPVSSPGRPG